MTNSIRRQGRLRLVFIVAAASLVVVALSAPLMFSSDPGASRAAPRTTSAQQAHANERRGSRHVGSGPTSGRGAAVANDEAREASAHGERTDVQPLAGPQTPPETDEIFTAALPDAPIGRAALKVIASANAGGPRAEQDYQAALDELREFGSEVVPMLSDAYDRLGRTSHLERQLVTHTLGKVESYEAVSKLQAIAGAPLPERLPEFEGTHGDPEREQEIMIRYLAIDGLQALARRGVQEADAALADLVRSTPRGIKERAVLAYVEGSGSRHERQQALIGALPKEERWMVHVATKSARDMPVARPPAGWLEAIRARRGRPSRSQTPRTARLPEDWSANSEAATRSE